MGLNPAALTLAIILIAIPAGANHVPGHEGPPDCYGLLYAVPGPNGDILYIDERNFSDGNSISLWFYVESNGVSGLQRGGTSLLGDQEKCIDPGQPDTLLL